MREIVEKESELDPLLRESLDWVVRLTSGHVTQGDADSLQAWKARSPAHEEALKEALRLRRMLQLAGRDIVSNAPLPRQSVPVQPARASVGRRAVLGGALAASAVGVVFGGARLGFWPTLSELGADYRTATGEQRKVALASGLALELNTQTSISVDLKSPQPRIELISGEANVSADLKPAARMTLVAGSGVVRATRANFDVRYIGRTALVTCVGGEVAVRRDGLRVLLAPGQQITYADTRKGLGPVEMADTASALAWRQGLLIFRDRPLSEMLAEINRYRPGHIILANPQLARRTFNGVFHIDHLDAVPAQLHKLGVNVHAIGAGIVLVS